MGSFSTTADQVNDILLILRGRLTFVTESVFFSRQTNVFGLKDRQVTGMFHGNNTIFLFPLQNTFSIF